MAHRTCGVTLEEREPGSSPLETVVPQTGSSTTEERRVTAVIHVDFAVENQRRFWAKVDRTGGDGACWPWTGSRHAKGYGMFHLGVGSQRAHRVAYEMVHGKIPRRMLVCHRCDNPPCVNPTHLFLGTDTDNIRDSFAKGRRRNDGEHHPRARLTAADVSRIRAAAQAHGRDHSWRTGLARELGITRKYIEKIVRGECWAVRS